MMQIVEKDISVLKPAKYNPRTITKQELLELAKSIKEFGLVDPIICNNDLRVIGGHQRIKACEVLGIKKVPCIILDISKTKEKQLNIALNNIQGEFDNKKLFEILSEIRIEIPNYDFEQIGFTQEEINRLLKLEIPEDDFDTEKSFKEPKYKIQTFIGAS